MKPSCPRPREAFRFPVPVRFAGAASSPARGCIRQFSLQGPPTKSWKSPAARIAAHRRHSDGSVRSVKKICVPSTSSRRGFSNGKTKREQRKRTFMFSVVPAAGPNSVCAQCFGRDRMHEGLKSLEKKTGLANLQPFFHPVHPQNPVVSAQNILDAEANLPQASMMGA